MVVLTPLIIFFGLALLVGLVDHVLYFTSVGHILVPIIRVLATSYLAYRLYKYEKEAQAEGRETLLRKLFKCLSNLAAPDDKPTPSSSSEEHDRELFVGFAQEQLEAEAENAEELIDVLAAKAVLAAEYDKHYQAYVDAFDSDKETALAEWRVCERCNEMGHAISLRQVNTAILTQKALINIVNA